MGYNRDIVGENLSDKKKIVSKLSIHFTYSHDVHITIKIRLVPFLLILFRAE